MITADFWAKALTAAVQLNPYGKKLDDSTLELSYLLIPEKVKQEVSDEMLLYALMQHKLNPNPDKELGPDEQLFSHIYRMRDERPCFAWGLKEDLPARMANRNVFHGQPLSGYQLGQDQHKPDLEPVTPLGLLIGGLDDAA